LRMVREMQRWVFSLGRRVSWADHAAPILMTSSQLWERVLGLRD
jgi:hypothetical protein